MFHKIMVPVDLDHKDKLSRALDVAASIAKSESATICYVGVTAATPSHVAHTPEEYGRKLAAFASEQGAAHGAQTESKVVLSHDPRIDLDNLLLETIDEIGADLVVMQSHVPGVLDHIWASNGGVVANRAEISVMLVR